MEHSGISAWLSESDEFAVWCICGWSGGIFKDEDEADQAAWRHTDESVRQRVRAYFASTYPDVDVWAPAFHGQVPASQQAARPTAMDWPSG